MSKGILYALAACVIWGLIFIIPEFIIGYNALEICLGRYFVYGTVSGCIFLSLRLNGQCNHPLNIWLKALGYSLFISIQYYTLLVLSVRFSTPAISALILGLSPIAIAFYGSWKEKEKDVGYLVLPSILILLGLIAINAPQIQGEKLYDYLLGILFAFGALACWTWYVVYNSKFLKDNPHVSSSDWSTMIGASGFVWVMLLAPVLHLFELVNFNKFTEWTPLLSHYIVGCLVLGMLCSWVGGYFWNNASLNLPVAIAGQLTIFETVFGVAFFYIIEQRFPSLPDCIGISLFFLAVGLCIRARAKRPVELHS